MKRPSLIAIAVPASAYMYVCAPGVVTAVATASALIMGFCFFERLLDVVREVVQKSIHRQSFKPPANLVVLGVILSMVCAALGFCWNPQAMSLPTIVMIKGLLSMLSIAGHIICLGALACAATLIETAPNLRNSRG
ncbi:MAG: hypothetical protein SGJ27_27845 [Candidatus Melainabacteria bacterium]|nr:hypothetical protein [Candidatus Melainabacteria bacterium]